MPVCLNFGIVEVTNVVQDGCFRFPEDICSRGNKIRAMGAKGKPTKRKVYPKIDNIKESLDGFVKEVILSKARPAVSVLDKYDGMCHALEREIWGSDVLPQVKKGMLRSPEVAIFGVERLLELCSASLDGLETDIQKMLSPAVASTNETLRDSSLHCSTLLAAKISSEGAFLSVARGLVDVLSMKLPTPDHKSAVIRAIEQIYDFRPEFSGDGEVIKFCDALIKAASSEGNDALSAQIYDVLGVWMRSVVHAWPGFQTFVMTTLKASPSQARLAALRCIALYCANNACDFVAKTPFQASIEAQYQKSGESAQNISELFPLALLYLKIGQTKKDPSVSQKILANPHFQKERLVSSSSSKDMVVMLNLVMQLLTSESGTVSDTPDVIYHLLTVAFCWPEYAVRRVVESFIQTSDCAKSVQFVAELFEYAYKDIDSNGLDQLLQKVYPPSTEVDDKNGFKIPGRLLQKMTVLLLNGVAHVQVRTEDNWRIILMASLPLCSLPRVVEYDGSLWIRSLHRFCKSTNFFSDETFCRNFVGKVFDTERLEVKLNMISLLIAEGDTSALMNSEIWIRIRSLIGDMDTDEFYVIPEEHYHILETPEGTLYSTNVIDENSDENLDTKNVRRENKTYSIKEQQAELQLRKELAEKKRAEGKLSKKQEKAIEEQLKKESGIRQELLKTQCSAKEKLNILAAAIHANPTGALKHIDMFYVDVIGLLKSPLVSKFAVECFLAFRDSAFDPSDDYLHEIVAHASLREFKSHNLYSEWCDEPLADQIGRSISLLSALCMDFGIEETELDPDFYRESMNVAKLAFVFPLVKSVLRSTKYPSSLKSLVVDFIKDAVRKAFIREEEVGLVPLVEYADLLLSLIGNNDYSHVFDICSESLANMAEIIEMSGQPKEGVRFYQSLLPYLTDAASDERRVIALRTLSKLYLTMTSLVKETISRDFVHRIYVAKFDATPEVATIADKIFADFGLETDSQLCDEILTDVRYEKINCTAVPAALKAILQEYPEKMIQIMSQLKNVYEESKEPAGGEIDQFGRVVVEPKDQYPVRLGCAFCFLSLAHIVNRALAVDFIALIVPSGLCDVHAECRSVMVNAACKVINRFGEQCMNQLLPLLEDLLDALSERGEDDILREGLVVLLGTLAKDLNEGNPKLSQIFGRLISTLSTPSQQVQQSVAKCLSPLVPLMPEQAKELLQHLLNLLFSESTYGERRGAAYGIGGIVKGLGLYQLSETEIMGEIKGSMMDKKSAKKREGGLFAMEMLSYSLGNLFEPYILQITKDMLLAFGDSNDSVRKSAEDASKAMMSILSVYGVKLLMPAILSALEEDSWRTKCASVDLLGNMAFCAPQQLSSCLPSIVPQLIEVLADSHIKVRASGERALKRIAQVIRNPEILAVSSHLLGGLVDPAEKTSSCLQIIVNTKFIHYIDSPSLALIMPIIRRAFSDRSTETRRMAAQIIANIYSLTEHKDMEPYLDELIPGLKHSLMDPVPEVRAVSAKALGAIIAFSSEERSKALCDEIIPWLKENLVSPTSSVDRSGAAQGLAEVLFGIGEDNLALVMPDIIKTTEAEDVEPHVRDGYILMYIYLPIVFGEKFIPYLPGIVPSILKALADENEYVRHSALKAGQRLIQTYVNQAKKLLLPELQRAMFDDNWRIRHASVTLIGDFLFNISGVSGKMTTDTGGEDETMGMEAASKVIARTLGTQMRDNILARLYLIRSDVALVVRQAASHVWKVVVTNTPRTVKEIMKPMFEGLLSCLSSNSEDRKQMAARCLEELVRKMGERLITDVLPVLKEALETPDTKARIGASAALNEIISNVPRETVQIYADNLVPLFAITLTDTNEVVRQSAAKTFNAFFHSIGPSALDVVITPLFNSYWKEKDDAILGSLCAIMNLNGRRVLPFLLPKLTKAPVDINSLCKLCGAAAESITHHIEAITKCLVQNFPDMSTEDLLLCEPLITSIIDEEDASAIVVSLMEHAQSAEQLTALRLLKLFLEKTKTDVECQLEYLIPNALIFYASSNNEVVEATIGLLSEAAKKLSGTNFEHIMVLQAAVNNLQRHATGKKLNIPGLETPKGLQPLLPCLREGVLNGAVDVKELAGNVLGRLLLSCTGDAIKPHVISVTGPMIRILGDRFPSAVKVAILGILSTMLTKTGPMMRPFVPQLQSTILKAAQDPSASEVRLGAGQAIAHLLKIHAKPDSAPMEFVKFVSACEDEEMRENAITSLRIILKENEQKLSPATVESVKAVI
ncbi:hypothetical protein L596_004659 [Steinernema carpocapsae]|uniref:TOG domain-containing protein n=1 Tax=Steinernema carpocapsae TaxID=34508 RepID=A0A4U8UWH3_STECR|nr:hypothetical protein L596_004659 [Steinernema carpocapsae]